MVVADQAPHPLLSRAIRLFEFLARAQQLKSHTTHIVDTYEREGSVLWFADLPEHPAVRSRTRGGDPEPDEVLLTLDRVARLAPPTSSALSAWLDGPADDPEHRPQLRETVTEAVDDQLRVSWDDDGTGGLENGLASVVLRIDDHPDVLDTYGRWSLDWEAWAEQEQRDRGARDVYGELFSTYVSASGHPEELELVTGVGCLTWSPVGGHPPVRRHLLTVPATIEFDNDSGRLSVRRAEGGDAATVELDMLDPGLVTNPQHINEVRADARLLEAHPLHRQEYGALVRRLVYTLDAGGEYSEADTPPPYSPNARAAFAPALILRKRSQQGLVDIFQTIVAQLGEQGVVPDGILPLVDPDHRPEPSRSQTEGALVFVDDDAFLPLPVNDVQLRIIKQVDAAAQTVVQGPPGTGKTHTAAALISHLLAQGLRVLVTAHTDRALKEVRDKLPLAIRPLAVAVVGSSREEMSDLKVAVERIAATAGEHDAQSAAATTLACLEEISSLRQQRAGRYAELVAAREREVVPHKHGGHGGTLASIALTHQNDAAAHSWLVDFVTVSAGCEPPLSTSEVMEWHAHLLDEAFVRDESEARQRYVPLTAVPPPAAFADMVIAERAAIINDENHVGLKDHVAFEGIKALPVDVRQELHARLHGLADEADNLIRRREAWMNEALADVRSGRATSWLSRGSQIADLIGTARAFVELLGAITQVEVSETNVAPLVSLAHAVKAHLVSGGKLRCGPDGTPKLGPLTPKVVKQAAALFELVRVDGLPPTTATSLGSFLAWAEASKTLAALDRAWPEGVRIPLDDTLHERLQWHITEHEQLQRVLALAGKLESEEQRLAQLRLPKPDWYDLAAVRTYASLAAAAAASDARVGAGRPLELLEAALLDAARWADAAPSVHRMLQAVRTRDHDEYAAVHGHVIRLDEVRRLMRRRDELHERLRLAAPSLSHAVGIAPSAEEWRPRLARFGDAWAWAATASWIRQQRSVDVNAQQAEITRIEERIRGQVETLSATRAWAHAVSPGRLTGQARADLEHYAYLVRRLGKGSGKYAPQQRADIRKAMDRCRPAVPVWIMPVYRIAEQLKVQPNMFDVVIVDEASQAGLEATFLQYLAPRIVVIGDDKQVSPTAVGIDQQQLRDLASQYLADDPYRSTWQDPLRSLFDEAKMRYGGMLTLTEHHRCVPEIIGFSNRIAYEPDGVRLIPVRQYGVDRLEPIKAVHLREGFVQGSTHQINPVEVAAIVEQIEKCTADPRYDGLTFGVISLLGGAQAKEIEKRLLEQIAPEEWAARDLRCGDSADFQGSERDVMFLSMVKAPEVGRTLGSLTRDVYMQRYNVAASRAKDQMWLFHSVGLNDLNNPEDMRFQLLDYCYGVIRRAGTKDDRVLTTTVPEGSRVEPFDSLFEQRVFNRLVDRGYTVIPQYPVDRYRLDLVVVGAKSRLAIECDGDAWHGPDAYAKDLARQRDMERCGWQFCRVTESKFYVDQAGALEEIWSALRELEIHPSGWTPESLTDLQADLSTPIEESPDPSVSMDLSSDGPSGFDAAVLDERGRASLLTELAAPGHGVTANPLEQTALSADRSRTAAPTVPTQRPVAATFAKLAKYQAFTGSVAPAEFATRRQLVEHLVQVVEAEGPVLGQRLRVAYVKASNGQRVGKQIALALNSAISEAVRQGLLVEDNPLLEWGSQSRTYRLPHQPEVVVRHMGPRTLEDVPPRELAALLTLAGDDCGWDSNEILFRMTLDMLGLKRLTTNVRDRLEVVFAWLCRQETETEG